ncbi:MAG: DUF3099 domain-containing protein [Actinobacteria bacterium]|nr:DUF3099 domain-containing protein [Actinomycetota bacterium]
MVRRTPDAAVTSLPRAPRDEARTRVRHYVITMSIRMVCFVLMFVVQPMGWWTWVFGIAAAVLPYIAVVFANAGDDSVPTTVESPLIELEATAHDPQAAPQDPAVITIAEAPAHTAEPRS